jgi:hypothetical protein
MEGAMWLGLLVLSMWVFNMITPRKGGPRDLNNH